MMKQAFRLPLIIIFAGFVLLTTITAQARIRPEIFEMDQLNAPIEQASNSTITPTATLSIDEQTNLTPTLAPSVTLTLEPFSTVTLVFPELTGSTTPTNVPFTKEPTRGIPLSQIYSNNPPLPKTGLFGFVIFFWFVLLVFAVFIARKASQNWSE